MNLALEKGVRVTTGGEGRGEIGGEAGEVTGVAIPPLFQLPSPIH